MADWSPLGKALGDGASKGVAPHIAFVAWREGAPVFAASAGAAHGDTVFDLASLTKPLATAPLALDLARRGRLDWDQPLGELWGPSVPADKQAITPRQLLTHAAGLPAHRPYFSLLEGQLPTMRRGLLKAMLLNEPLEAAPGARALYSDLGYLLLGLLIEDFAGRTLDAAAAELYARLGLTGPAYAPVDREPPWDLGLVAPCGPLPGREVIHGQVEDENAFALGGVAGHAGLFGTADQVARLMSRLSQGWEEILARDAATPGSGRTPGFDTPSGPETAAGASAPAGVVGHLGFTGVSLWWLPAEDTGAVLLTNRVALGRDNGLIHPFRRRVHDLAWRLLLED